MSTSEVELHEAARRDAPSGHSLRAQATLSAGQPLLRSASFARRMSQVNSKPPSYGVCVSLILDFSRNSQSQADVRRSNSGLRLGSAL